MCRYSWIFFVIGSIFLHTKSDKIGYRSIQALKTRKVTEIIQGIKIVIEKYLNKGFKISKWHRDNSFNCTGVEEAILPKKMNAYTRNEHVGPIEISIREIKERTRSTCQLLPYIPMPKIMIQELIAGIIKNN